MTVKPCCRENASGNAEQDEADVAELGKHLESIIGMSSAVQKYRDWQQERQGVAAQVQELRAICNSLDEQVPPLFRARVFEASALWACHDPQSVYVFFWIT